MELVCGSLIQNAINIRLRLGERQILRLGRYILDPKFHGKNSLLPPQGMRDYCTPPQTIKYAEPIDRQRDSSTIWVCVTSASRRPSALVTRVCHTIVRRPR